MISRKLAFPSGAQKSVLRGTFGIKPSTRFADEKAGFYDRDARDYFARAGLKSELGKDQISRFVKGIKKLGLWNNMVCWPMRSTQNSAVGNDVYSLGGAARPTGTMSNSPTRLTTGLQFDGSSSYVDLNFTPADYLSTSSNAIGVAMPTTPTSGSGASYLVIGNIASGGLTQATAIGSDTFGSVRFANSQTGLTGTGTGLGRFEFVQATNETTNHYYKNGINASQSAPAKTSFASGNLYVGAVNQEGSAVLFSNATIAAAFVFTRALSNGEHLALAWTYQLSMGQGLGLRPGT